jgi:hypothetical protein
MFPWCAVPLRTTSVRFLQTLYVICAVNRCAHELHHRAMVLIGWTYLSKCSVRIVSDYSLDAGVRSPAEAKEFSSSLCVQSSSEAHPAFCTVGTWGPFPGSKVRPGRDSDHSFPI